MGKPWSEEEIKYLKENYSKMDIEDILKNIHRTYNSITSMARIIGSKKRGMTHDEFCKYIELNSKIRVVGGKYTGSINCILKFKCLIHDYEWESVPRNVYDTLRCPRCHLNKKRTHLDFVEEMKEINPNIKIIFEFVGTQLKIKFLCLIHDQEFETKAVYLLRGRACPICKESVGEKRIRKFLIKNNILYKSQKTFKSLKGCGNRLLRFDFCILNKDGSIFSLIEYQGGLHFKSVGSFGGDETLLITKEHDRLKKEFCRNNGYYLSEINYWDFNKIEQILEKELSPFLERR